MATSTAAIPFTSAALRYREKFYSKSGISLGAAPQDISPPGGAVKSYGYLRRIVIVVTGTGGSGGALAADAPWNFFANISVTQPNGEEMFGGPTFSGYHAYLAAKHSAHRYANSPAILPSYIGTAPNFRFVLPIVFEMDAEKGVGALANMDFSAPWKLTLTVNTSGAVFATAPVTDPTFQVDCYIDCWTVPSPTNALNPEVHQETAPPLLGALNKWTIQQYSITPGSQQNVLLSRKGNAIRNLLFIVRDSAGARVAGFPNPATLTWDGTVVRSNDDPLLWVDDEYATVGGLAYSTPVAPDTGVYALKMSDIAGIDIQGAAELFGMGGFWGTVQSSTLQIGGTWGGTAATLEVLTNDVQFVDLSGNPYAFSAGGYLQRPSQPSARP